VHVAAADPHTGYQKESEKGAANGYASLDAGGTVPDVQIPVGIARDTEVAAGYQPLDADLTAIAGLTSAANKGIQFTGAGTAATYDLTTAGKALLDDADAAAQRATLGLVIGTNVQAYDADLTTWAGVTPGTGIATALAVNAGTDGAPVIQGGALGTPSSGVTDNLTTTTTTTAIADTDFVDTNLAAGGKRKILWTAVKDYLSILSPVAFSALPAASSVPNVVRAVSLPNGRVIELRSDGSVWRPNNGRVVLHHNGPTPSITVQSLTEAIAQTVGPFPGGLVRAGMKLYVTTRFAVPGIGTGGRLVKAYASPIGVFSTSAWFGRVSSAVSNAVNSGHYLGHLLAGSDTTSGHKTTSLSAVTGYYQNATEDGNGPSQNVNFANDWEFKMSGASCAETAQTGVTATWSGGVATFAKTAHGYAVGDKIVTTTFDLTGYNGTLIVASIPTADAWTAAIATDPGGAGSGGTSSRTSNVRFDDFSLELIG
jgi:hypothetical protein